MSVRAETSAAFGPSNEFPIDQLEYSKYPFIFTNKNGNNGLYAHIDNLPTGELVMDAAEASEMWDVIDNKREMYRRGFSQSMSNPTPEHSDDLIDDFLHDSGNKPLLTFSGEQMLGRAIMAGQQLVLVPELSTGDPDKDETILRTATLAWRHFISANSLIAVSVVNSAQRSSDDVFALLGEVNEVNMRAVSKFDYRKGWKYSTYFYTWARQAIQRERRKSNPTKYSEEETANIGALERDEQEHPDPEDRTLASIAGRVHMTPEQIVALRAKINRSQPVSLDMRIGEDGHKTLGEMQTGEPIYTDVVERAESQDITELMRRAVEQLPAEEADAFRLYLRNFAETGNTIMSAEFYSEYTDNYEKFRRRIERAKEMLAHPSFGLTSLTENKHNGKPSFSDALCIGEPVGVFFPERGFDRSSEDRRAELCDECPVRNECAALAVKLTINTGYFGNVSPTVRRRERRELYKQALEAQPGNEDEQQELAS